MCVRARSCTHVYIYIYIYRERERERKKEREREREICSYLSFSGLLLITRYRVFVTAW